MPYSSFEHLKKNIMKEFNLSHYKKLLLDSLRLRLNNEEEKEQEILERLDIIWEKLSLDDQNKAKDFVKEVVQKHLDKTVMFFLCPKHQTKTKALRGFCFGHLFS